MTRLVLALGALGLAVATVVVFRAFDAHSHSASDTLRPFVLTMGSVWGLAVLVGRALLRRRG